MKELEDYRFLLNDEGKEVIMMINKVKLMMFVE
jgi:hypothetical protein